MVSLVAKNNEENDIVLLAAQVGTLVIVWQNEVAEKVKSR